jgi:hypothetical protein
MIPAPLLPPVAVLLIAVNVAMWIASLERREAGRVVIVDDGWTPIEVHYG